MKITTDYKYLNPDTPQVSVSLTFRLMLSPQISFKLFSQSYSKDQKLMFALLPLNEHEMLNSVDVVELQAVSFESYKYSHAPITIP